MRWIGFIITLCLAAGIATAQSRSAAELYRVAVRSIPAPNSDVERHIWVDVLDAPLDGVDQLLQRHTETLDLVDTASQMPFGSWGFREDDALAGGKTIPGIEKLGDLLVLRARVHAAAHDYPVAVDDCMKIALLARRLSANPGLARQAQQNVIMHQSLSAIAQFLPNLSTEQIRRMLVRLDELRAPIDAFEVANIEKQRYVRFYRTIVADQGLQMINLRLGATLNEIFGFKVEPVDVWRLAADPALGRQVFDEMERAFDEMIVALKVPQAERSAAVRAAAANLRGGHRLAQNATRIVETSFALSESQASMLRLFKTAATICAEDPRPLGPDTVRKRAASGQFTLTPTGFDLSDPPLILHVGPQPVRARDILP